MILRLRSIFVLQKRGLRGEWSLLGFSEDLFVALVFFPVSHLTPRGGGAVSVCIRVRNPVLLCLFGGDPSRDIEERESVHHISFQLCCRLGWDHWTLLEQVRGKEEEVYRDLGHPIFPDLFFVHRNLPYFWVSSRHLRHC